MTETVNATGGVVSRYAQGLNVDEPLAELQSGTSSYYETDGSGSVTSLTNSAGAVAATYTFDSFGKITNSAGSLQNPFRYTGREFDTETNLYYYRARYYDSSTGRFFSEDPIGFHGGPNVYRYVGNNPTLQTDPFGLKGETALFSEAGPNPYYKGGTGRAEWDAFKDDFTNKCEAAKQPGESTVSRCTQSVGVLGPVAYCMCCESCEDKK